MADINEDQIKLLSPRAVERMRKYRNQHTPAFRPSMVNSTKYRRMMLQNKIPNDQRKTYQLSRSSTTNQLSSSLKFPRTIHRSQTEKKFNLSNTINEENSKQQFEQSMITNKNMKSLSKINKRKKKRNTMTVKRIQLTELEQKRERQEREYAMKLLDQKTKREIKKMQREKETKELKMRYLRDNRPETPDYVRRELAAAKALKRFKEKSIDGMNQTTEYQNDSINNDHQKISTNNVNSMLKIMDMVDPSLQGKPMDTHIREFVKNYQRDSKLFKSVLVFSENQLIKLNQLRHFKANEERLEKLMINASPMNNYHQITHVNQTKNAKNVLSDLFDSTLPEFQHRRSNDDQSTDHHNNHNSDSNNNNNANEYSMDSLRSALCIDILNKLADKLPQYSKLLEFLTSELCEMLFKNPTIDYSNHMNNNNNQDSNNNDNDVSSFMMDTSRTPHRRLRNQNTYDPRFFQKSENKTLELLSMKCNSYREIQMKNEMVLRKTEKELRMISSNNICNLAIQRMREENSTLLNKFTKKVFIQWKKHTNKQRKLYAIAERMGQFRNEKTKMFIQWKQQTMRNKIQSQDLNIHELKVSNRMINLDSRIIKSNKDHFKHKTEYFQLISSKLTDLINEHNCEHCLSKFDQRKDNLINELKHELGSSHALLEQCGLIDQ